MGRKGDSKRKPKSKKSAGGDASGSIASLGHSTDNMPARTTDASKAAPVRGGGYAPSDGKKKSKKG
ncbi:MAG: hypothetical protein HGA53_10485 [Anaerolineaceae bacterium]|nr:hypothetical protein [Anaerolineaceae bacterium]